VLELYHLTAGYGTTTVLRDINLIVPDSSVVGLLGPNGAGKTTLLRVASGLLSPMRGQLLLDGDDVTRSPPHDLVARGVCHIPEGRGIFPSLTVRDNLILQVVHGQVGDAIDQAISAFPRLGERTEQLAGTLSGGEQQMLALARAYIQSPTIVLLDEVSMGLAPRVVDEIFEFLTLLRSQGASLLLVEQYVTRAMAVSDYVYLLQRGELIFAGEPNELEGDDIFAQYIGVASAD
jgi:branched-chain amino acid transport system ATP-binding protein